MEASY
jgi:hypothetical protein